MDDSLVPIAGTLALLVLVVVAVVAFVSNRAAGKRQTALEEAKQREQDERTQNGVKQGLLAKDTLTGEVYIRCAICGERAIACSPISGVSWMDTLPLLNRLHSLAPRYVIVDNEEVGPQLCKIHKQVAMKKMEEFHALLRAERAKFNSHQEDKIAQMDGGALVRVIQGQYKESVAAFTPPEPVRQLPPAKESLMTTIVTSSSSKTEIEGEDVA